MAKYGPRKLPRCPPIPKDSPADPNGEILDPKKRLFLAAFAETGIVTRSADLVGIDHSTPWSWRQKDPAFAQAFEIARRKAGEDIFLKARELVTKGAQRYVLFEGKPIPHPDPERAAAGEFLMTTEIPTALMIFMLKLFGMDEHGLRSIDRTDSESAGGRKMSQADMLVVAMRSMTGDNACDPDAVDEAEEQTEDASGDESADNDDQDVGGDA